MIVTYQGENYFKLQAGEVSLLIDPTNARSFKGAKAVVSTLKPGEIEPPQEETGAPFYIDHQGEYEIGGVVIEGWSSGNEDDHEKTVYRILLDNLSVACLGYLKKSLAPSILSHLVGVDILIVPAGGKPWIATGDAAKLIRQIEPGIIIPSLFKDLKPFLKEFGKDTGTPEEKLVVKKKEIKEKAMRVVPLAA